MTIDASDPNDNDTAKVGQQFQERQGRCDILINNAAIYPFANITGIDLTMWRRVISTNLDPCFSWCMLSCRSRANRTGAESSTSPQTP